MPPQSVNAKRWATQACADDFATKVLVDNYLGISSQKFTKTDLGGSRCLNFKSLSSIIREYVGAEICSSATAKDLWARNVKAKANATGDPAGEVMHSLVQLLERFSAACTWEISTTCRFGPKQGMILARRQMEIGEDVASLFGEVAVVPDTTSSDSIPTPDFSIIDLDGKDHSLFGCLRYVNHACRPNTRFIRLSRSRIGLRTKRRIKIGEEITVKYSSAYFGRKNADCLCHTCQPIRDGKEQVEHGEHCLIRSPNKCILC